MNANAPGAAQPSPAHLAQETRRQSRRELLAEAVKMRDAGRYPYGDGWYTIRQIERVHALRVQRDRALVMQAAGAIGAGWVVFLGLLWLMFALLLPG